MELETEAGGRVPDPTVDDIREVFEPDAVVGGFIRLSRAVDDFLDVQLEDADVDRSPDWDEGIRGVYLYDSESGRYELENWSPDGYGGDTYGGEHREQLREMFLHFLRGPRAFDQWRRSWNGNFRGDC
jgi:hypothetical protein